MLRSRYAVVTNDLQYDLVDKNAERRRIVDAFLPGFVQFLTDMRALAIPIIHLQLINLADDPAAERFGDVLPVTKGSPGARILTEVSAWNDLTIEKHKDSGFFETTLDATLKKLQIDTIVITGMQTQICVQTTAADGFFRGYHVVVPTDGVVSTRQEDTDRALEWLDSYCAVVMPMRDIVASLQAHEDIKPKMIKVP